MTVKLTLTMTDRATGRTVSNVTADPGHINEHLQCVCRENPDIEAFDIVVAGSFTATEIGEW